MSTLFTLIPESRRKPSRSSRTWFIIVAERKEGFLWSSLAKSTDGQTVVNIEAIQEAGNVGEFFSDPVFVEKFRKLDEVSKSEFHTYTVGDLVLPKRAAEA